MQSCEFVIHPLTGNDAGAVLAFSRQIGGETDHLTFGPEGLPLGEEQERGFLEKAADTPDRLMLGAWDGERLVGTAEIARLSNKARLAHRAQFAVSVARSHWNRGIASALACRCLQRAREMGCTVVELEVLENNAPAIHLYQKLGFSAVGRHPCFFRYADGRCVPALLMHCYL